MFGIRGGEDEEAFLGKVKGLESGFDGGLAAARVTLVPDKTDETDGSGFAISLADKVDGSEFAISLLDKIGGSGFAISWPSWSCEPCSPGRVVGSLVLLSMEFMASGFLFSGNSFATDFFSTAGDFLSHAVIDDCIACWLPNG